jgi:hypothetical protein
LVLWARLAGTRDFYPSFAALVGPVQNILFLAHFITFCVPIAQQPGQAVVLGRLSLGICLWIYINELHAYCLVIYIYYCTVWWLASLRVCDPGLLFSFYYKIKLRLEYKIRN